MHTWYEGKVVFSTQHGMQCSGVCLTVPMCPLCWWLVCGWPPPAPVRTTLAWYHCGGNRLAGISGQDVGAVDAGEVIPGCFGGSEIKTRRPPSQYPLWNGRCEVVPLPDLGSRQSIGCAAPAFGNCAPPDLESRQSGGYWWEELEPRIRDQQEVLPTRVGMVRCRDSVSRDGGLKGLDQGAK